MGKVPVLETPSGCICEAAAIARYVARMRADTNMYGASFFEAGLVDQWIEFAKNELDLPVGMWIYPVLGFIKSNEENTNKAKQDIARAFKVLNDHLTAKTFLAGEGITAADVVVSMCLLNPFKLVIDAAYAAPFPALVRWFKTCITQPEFLAVIGTSTLLMGSATPAAPTPAPAPAPAPAKAPAEKKEKPKKEEKPKAEKKEEKKEDPEKAAKEAAKAKEKLLKTVIKEGGKKGVEIEGASDMGGLDFFCTTIESPEGDIEMLQLAMTSMNADPDPEGEDRKGCSGHVGKMVFSAGTKQLAIVGYVPDAEHNKSASKVDIDEWTKHVAAAVGAKVVKGGTAAASPRGGKVTEAIVAADPDKGKFPIKDKDTAMAAAFAYLRSKGAFPEDGSDDEDEVCFGDDAFDNIDEL
uniref:GST C-terminal domain-containing protein n=1 Tax=Haptolina ericina TaxID=156174 RepID=A0A7S3BJM6_9EUKA